MFDFRYHALSLAAVFIALVVGLLLGVAIGDKELVSGARQELRDSLRADETSSLSPIATPSSSPTTSARKTAASDSA